MSGKEYRILLLEDEPSTIRELLISLQRRLPNVVVHTAETVQAGISEINALGKIGLAFNVAVLDFKLPAAPGMEATTDFSLCAHIRERMKNTQVVHISSFDDPEILTHFRERHLRLGDPPTRFVQKKPNWNRELLTVAEAAIYDPPIRAQIRSIFGSSNGTDLDTYGAYQLLTTRLGADLTHRIALLIEDIRRDWEHLSPGLQAEIGGIFQVKSDLRPIRISLL